MPSRSGSGPPRGRQRKQRVKTARGRSVSSQRWLQRQLNDPYVAAARREGFASRAAFKLIELDEKFRLLRRGACVVDLGAAPGGWSQVARQRVGEQGRVVAVDRVPFEAPPGVEALVLDLASDAALERLRAELADGADLVLSDMAPSATGQRAVDHLRIVALAEIAVEAAAVLLRPGGALVLKVRQGGAEGELLNRLRRDFAQVRHAKPRASRAESAELYLVATGFRGTG